MFEEWKETLFHPEDIFPKLVEKANLETGLKYLAVGYIIFGILDTIAASLFDVAHLGFLIETTGGMIGIMKSIFTIIGGFIFALVFSAIVWIIARIFGGKGSYGAQLHMTSAPLALVLVINGILDFIPIVGIIISFLLQLYYLYPLTIAIKEVHKFSTLKAVALWLISYIIAVIVVFYLLVSTFSVIGTAVGLYNIFP
jgi:hypothetical protein